MKAQEKAVAAGTPGFGIYYDTFFVEFNAYFYGEAI
jgi:hypothetical protein